MKYDLGHSGIPFAGGVVSIISNFTNTGLLTIRVTGVSFASDFSSNGTRQVTSGFPFNPTAGMNKEADTPVLIPTEAFIGNHNVTSIATWQYSDSSGWHTAAPAVTSITVNVSQTIGSLLSGFVTTLLIGLGVAAAVLDLAAVLRWKRRKKPDTRTTFPAKCPPKPKTLSNHRHS